MIKQTEKSKDEAKPIWENLEMELAAAVAGYVVLMMQSSPCLSSISQLFLSLYWLHSKSDSPHGYWQLLAYIILYSKLCQRKEHSPFTSLVSTQFFKRSLSWIGGALGLVGLWDWAPLNEEWGKVGHFSSGKSPGQTE